MCVGPLSRVRHVLSHVRETLCLVPVVLREVIHETRDLAHLLWIEHENPSGEHPVLQEAPKSARETWWHVAAVALQEMRDVPDGVEVGADHSAPSLDELARLMRIRHARVFDRDAPVPEPARQDLEEWERLAAVALAWWAEVTSTPGAGELD